MEFKKYDKIRTLGDGENKDIFSNPEDEIIIEEKIDGANLRFMITKEGNIIFGSRTQQLTSDKGEDTNVEKNFRRCVEFIRKTLKENEPFPKNIKHLIFYGENCVKHTMDYNWEEIPPYSGFDIFDMRTGKYLDYEIKRNIFEDLGLELVPIISICQSKDIKQIKEEDIPKSKYASPSQQDQKCEGLVIKNYDKQIFAKYVRDKFKEKNREVFGGSKKFAKTDDEYFCAIYCTNARIDKCIFKLIDDGKKLDMSLMGELLNLVYRDIWEENWNEISFSKKKTDLLKLKKLVSKRCLEVLKQFLINNNLNNNEN